MDKYLVVVEGPTAVGKTHLAIELAKHFNMEIISADSRQFYKELSIGTAKPTEEELAEVPHHFVGHISIQQEYSAGQFGEEASKLLEKLFKKDRIALVVGGSGLYVKALIQGLHHMPEVPAKIKRMVKEKYNHEGIESLIKLIEDNDPKAHSIIDLKNPRRVIRAAEVISHTGKPISSFWVRGKVKDRDYKTIRIGLWLDRKLLYSRIEDRCDNMIKQGLLNEVKKLYPFKDIKALQTVGYQEFFSYMDGTCSIDEAIDLFKQHSRNYAKRQVTWLRKIKDITWYHPEEIDEIVSFIANKIY